MTTSPATQERTVYGEDMAQMVEEGWSKWRKQT